MGHEMIWGRGIDNVEVVVEHPPVDESQSNEAIEGGINKELDMEPTIWHWLVEFAADTFNRVNMEYPLQAHKGTRC